MPASCPACGSSQLLAVSDHYEAEVRKPQADPEVLAPLAPPIRRSIFHGTACIAAFFMALLSPGFVPPERTTSVLATFLALGSITFLTWVRARRTDRAAMAAYQKRRTCPECGWNN
jgi:ribosomal protein S27AE